MKLLTIATPALVVSALLCTMRDGLAQAETQDVRAFKAGTLPLFSSSEMVTLREHLRQSDWNSFLIDFFRDLYDSQFADLIIYIPKDGPTKQTLLWKETEREYLTGRKYLYVIIITENTLKRLPPRAVITKDSVTQRTVTNVVSSSDDVHSTILTTSPDKSDTTAHAPPTTDTIKTTTTTTLKSSYEATDAQLLVTLRSLDYQPDRFLIALVKSVAATLGAGIEQPTASAAHDTTLAVSLTPLGDPSQCHQLWLAMLRLPLVENTTNRVSVRPAAGRSHFPMDRSIHQNFGNFSHSRFGVSIGAGLTLDASRVDFKDTTAVAIGPETDVSLYLFGHFYLHSPRLPWQPTSFALVGGTNLFGGGLLDDIVAGISFGRVIGDLGFIVGLNLLEEEKREMREVPTTISKKRKVRAFFGVDFAL